MIEAIRKEISQEEFGYQTLMDCLKDYARPIDMISDLLPKGSFKDLLKKGINNLDVDQARNEVEPFVKNPGNLSIWSREFFLDVVSRIKLV
ncbi:MAG: hypothetical protein KKB35_06140 [Proteobacteria bacterium]|nr:hypothetical protein [Pseudomonadota bacterium]